MLGALLVLIIAIATGAAIDGKWALSWAAGLLVVGVWLLLRPASWLAAIASVVVGIVSCSIAINSYITTQGYDQTINVTIIIWAAAGVVLTLAGFLASRRRGA
jgi:hypothetical protein